MVLFLSYSQWKDRLIHWLFTALDREYSIYGKIPLWNWEEMTDIQCNIYYWNIHNDSMKTCIQTKYQFRNWMHSVGMLKKGENWGYGLSNPSSNFVNIFPRSSILLNTLGRSRVQNNQLKLKYLLFITNFM